jgi:hypothetical protein
VRALNAAGNIVATASMQPQQGVPHVLHLTGANIFRVVVDAPQDETLLHEICFKCDTSDGGATEKVTVKALHGDLVILETTAQELPDRSSRSRWTQTGSRPSK